jgi:nicotinamide-nucleotide amidase
MSMDGSGGGAEILCIGTELLLGNILNGNARWLAEELAALGIAHYRQTVVGDNADRLRQAVLEAAGRCDLLICTGGLGPTPDDLTTATLAEAFGAPLEERSDVIETIAARLGHQAQDLSAGNRKQALLPQGSTVLPNPTGTAPGMIWSPRPGFSLLTFPGVPSEMQVMWRATAVPWLRRQPFSCGVHRSRTLRFWGIGEGRLAERVADLLALDNPTVAPYAGAGEVTLRLTARADTIAAADDLLAPVEHTLRQRLGHHCFGGDDDSLASVVLQLLRQRHETLAVAESCTGGGIGAALAAVPGASDVFLGGVIAYANSVKQGLLQVPDEALARHGAVSDPVALAMAEGVRRCTGADWGVAVTGIAGPGGGSVDKPVGLVHIGLSGRDGSQSEAVRFGASRERRWIQTLTVGEALNRLRLQLDG